MFQGFPRAFQTAKLKVPMVPMVSRGGYFSNGSNGPQTRKVELLVG